MENLPIDIVLVRHGESEGNLAQARSKKGDDTLWTPEFAQRHTSNYRLTDIGREQARVAGAFIKDNIYPSFDNYYVSEYTRAQETAAILNFPNSRWHVEFYLREQDRGILGGKSRAQREKEHSDLLKMIKKDSFYVAAPGGESVASSCLRVDRVIHMWQMSNAGQRIIAVCHGNIMMAFRVRLERLSQARWQEIDTSNNPFDKLHNSQILQYSRRNPATGEIHSVPKWMRSICPWDLTRSTNEWVEINRPLLSNDDLLAEVNKIPQLINVRISQPLRSSEELPASYTSSSHGLSNPVTPSLRSVASAHTAPSGKSAPVTATPYLAPHSSSFSSLSPSSPSSSPSSFAPSLRTAVGADADNKEITDHGSSSTLTSPSGEHLEVPAFHLVPAAYIAEAVEEEERQHQQQQ